MEGKKIIQVWIFGVLLVAALQLPGCQRMVNVTETSEKTPQGTSTVIKSSMESPTLRQSEPFVSQTPSPEVPTHTQTPPVKQTAIIEIPTATVTAMQTLEILSLPVHWLTYHQGYPGQVLLVKPDGSGQRTLFYFDDFITNPKWSPDGQWLAFVLINSSWKRDIFIIRPDGTGLSQLTNNGQMKGGLDWSPDGRYIAFNQTNTENATSNLEDIYIVDIKTKAITTITDTPGLREISPSFSPLGNAIAYIQVGTGHNPNSLVSMDLETREIKIVSPDKSHITWYSWSPDAKRIAFTSGILLDNRYSCDQLFVIDIQSAQLNQLTQPNWEASRPEWSPDGEWIVFTFTECNRIEWENHGNQLYLVNISTGNIRKVMHILDFKTDGIDWYPLPFLQIGNSYTITTLGNNLNLRTGPGLAGQVALKLQEGEQIKVLEGPIDKDQFHWWHIEITKTGEQGWIAENLGWFKPK